MKLEESNKDDAINIAPHLHTVIYEDDRIRVMKVSVKPGDTAEMHWHPHNINYVLEAGKLKFNKQDGSNVEVELSKGQVTSSTVDSYHAVENTGDTLVETVQVEIKS